MKLWNTVKLAFVNSGNMAAIVLNRYRKIRNTLSSNSCILIFDCNEHRLGISGHIHALLG